MSYSTSQIQPQICCPNLACSAPLNALGSRVCESCQTPLIYRYLWAVGRAVEQIPAGTQVAGRYYITAPKIWLDTQPSLPLDAVEVWPDEVTPYLYLYPHRLHIPEVYGFCPQANAVMGDVILLENVPLDAAGHLYPAIAQLWSQATAVRQVYWLWQILQLWAPLAEQGVASSLLSASNIRVEGWRIRLCELFMDADVLPVFAANGSDSVSELGFADLANLWLAWAESARPEIAEPLKAICQQMQTRLSLEMIASQLNHLLLAQAAQLPLQLKIAGGSDQGPQRSHNEDTCYPVTVGAKSHPDGLMPRLAIVCDGIGGHEGGEVASQTAVRSLKLQIQALLTEITEQTELATPDLLTEQLEAIVRVVNNLIAAQNDSQGRENRRRMGTTLVMALQLPQRVQAQDGRVLDNGHELYLVHVGDSRAYWITPDYCHQLTVDDDVAAREVRMGRSLYREALNRSDAGSLTQAIGTRNAEFLHPTIQRFILEENGLLLLCSDGLSDNNLIEQHWRDHAEATLKGQHPLDLAIKTWIDLANHQNGHDNTSLVLMNCQVSASAASTQLLDSLRNHVAETEGVTASREAANGLVEPRKTLSSGVSTAPRSQALVTLLAVVALLLLSSGIGLFAWSQLQPSRFQQFREKLLPSSQPPNQSS